MRDQPLVIRVGRLRAKRARAQQMSQANPGGARTRVRPKMGQSAARAQPDWRLSVWLPCESRPFWKCGTFGAGRYARAFAAPPSADLEARPPAAESGNSLAKGARHIVLVPAGGRQPASCRHPRASSLRGPSRPIGPMLCGARTHHASHASHTHELGGNLISQAERAYESMFGR